METKTNETVPTIDPLDIIQDAVMTSLYPRGKHMRLNFTPQGLARYGQVLGWLHGLASTNRELARALARDFFARLDYLADYGGEIEEEWEGRTIRYSKWRVSLGDDGTFNGFTLGWYRAIPPERQVEGQSYPKEMQTIRYGTSYQQRVIEYGFDFCGGLIYHGPGAGQTFTVALDSSGYWGIHT